MEDIVEIKKMDVQASRLINQYMRTEYLPQIWCAGCGNGIIMRDVVQAIKNLELDQAKTVIVSGIGCSSRAACYLDFNTIHTTHGRAIAFATGIKLANPSLEVIVIAGDGDIAAIGGNHLIHAARRNIGVSVIVMNNNIYGMTGGQYSPTTPTGLHGTTAPYGSLDRPFDIAKLAAGAGASYAARGTAYHVRQTVKLIEDGIMHKGFSLIEVISTCPTYYGRQNKLGDGVEMLEWQQHHSINVEQAKTMTKEQLNGKIVIGLLHKVEAKEFSEAYQEMRDQINKEISIK